MVINNIKKGFTIPEILIVLVIISVIIVIMLTMIKPNNLVLKLQYYNAYYILATASYNIYDKALDENKIMYQDKELCEHLRGYINNNGEYTCSESFVGLDGKEFKPENIQFLSSNGTIYYFSKAFTLNNFGKDQKHRIVWIDLNGKRNPNSAHWKKSRPADIVAFDITDTGEVLPLGYPKIDTRYMTAAVVYPEEKTKSELLSFYSAQQIAFGKQEYEYETFSYNFDQKNPLFENSELRIEKKHLDKDRAQSPLCTNNADETFPKCSIDIIK